MADHKGLQRPAPTGIRSVTLMSKGARPDIFTFAMLGSYGVVKSIIENQFESVRASVK